MSDSGRNAPVDPESPAPKPSRTSTPSPTPTAGDVSTSLAAVTMCPMEYITKEVGLRSTADPNDTLPIETVNEPAVLAGQAPYCGFDWGHDSYQDILFEGGAPEAEKISQQLTAAGYSCTLDYIWYTCQQGVHTVSITIPDDLNPNAYDMLPIAHAFTVEASHLEPCADDPQYNCLLPW